MHLQRLLLISAALSVPAAAMSPPKALIYRGPSACDGCPEAIAHLLRTSEYGFDCSYAGPDEDLQISSHTLKDFDVFAQPGGPDLDDAWKELKSDAHAIRQFVSNGGRYMGFCLGAFIAGHSPGFNLLPENIDTDSENSQDGAQVKSEKDTIIQVDWRFSSGPEAGRVERKRWVYFQDGAVMEGFGKSNDSRVLARYSSNGDVAASLTPYGSGWVGLTGPHVEATADWYAAYNISNPDGVRLDIGYDFVHAIMNAKQSSSTATSSAAGGDQTSGASRKHNPLKFW